VRKGRLRIREREREHRPIVSLIIGQLLYVEQHARAFYIFIHTHTKRCEIIKQTNKQKKRKNSTSPFAVDAAQPMMWFKQYY